MLDTVRRSLACLSALVILTTLSSAGEPSLANRLPAGAVATLEGQGWSEAITRLEQSDLATSLAASPNYKEFQDSDPGRNFMAGLALLQAQYGKEAWSIARDLLGDRWIVGVYPPQTEDKPVAVALIRTESPDVVAHIRTKLEPLVPLAGDKLKTESIAGGLRLVNADGSVMVLFDRWIALGNQRDQVDQVEAALRSERPDHLAASQSWRNAPHSERSDTKLEVWVDLALIRQKLQQDRLLPDKLDNPLASLLLGGVMAYASQAEFATATLDLTDSVFELRAFVPGTPDAIAAPQQSLLPPADADGEFRINSQLAGFSLIRDWANWYGQRESLMIERLLPEFDKFETGLATFLPGKDFRTDALPLFSRRLQIVSAPQTYAHLEGRPGVQLPAVAVLIELEQPEAASDLLQMVFQTITAIVNLQAGQEKRTPWVMSSETYQGVQISFAKYLQQPKGTDLPVAFNFQPSAARLGRRFVIATSQELCRQVIDALQAPPAESASQVAQGRRDWSLELAPSVVANLLEANRAILEAKAVQDGNSPEQAAGNLDLAVKLLQRLEPISLSSTLQPDGYLWRLQGGWAR